jgi:hypothetical protein
MLFDHQYRFHVRGARVADLVFLLLMLGALGYAISTQIEDAQLGANLIGVSSAGAVQQQTPLRAVEYFPAGYVNQAKEIEEHIEAF